MYRTNCWVDGYFLFGMQEPLKPTRGPPGLQRQTLFSSWSFLLPAFEAVPPGHRPFPSMNSTRAGIAATLRTVTKLGGGVELVGQWEACRTTAR